MTQKMRAGRETVKRKKYKEKCKERGLEEKKFKPLPRKLFLTKTRERKKRVNVTYIFLKLQKARRNATTAVIRKTSSRMGSTGFVVNTLHPVGKEKNG